MYFLFPSRWAYNRGIICGWVDNQRFTVRILLSIFQAFNQYLFERLVLTGNGERRLFDYKLTFVFTRNIKRLILISLFCSGSRKLLSFLYQTLLQGIL